MYTIHTTDRPRASCERRQPQPAHTLCIAARGVLQLHTCIFDGKCGRAGVTQRTQGRAGWRAAPTAGPHAAGFGSAWRRAPRCAAGPPRCAAPLAPAARSQPPWCHGVRSRVLGFSGQGGVLPWQARCKQRCSFLGGVGARAAPVQRALRSVSRVCFAAGKPYVQGVPRRGGGRLCSVSHPPLRLVVGIDFVDQEPVFALVHPSESSVAKPQTLYSGQARAGWVNALVVFLELKHLPHHTSPPSSQRHPASSQRHPASS
jgi:hypothetical protein